MIVMWPMPFDNINLFYLNFRYSNSSQNGDNVKCRQMANGEKYDYPISNACEGHNLIQNCPPLYISVQAAPTAVPSSNQCSDIECRFPNDIKYTITTDNLGCYSSTTKLMLESIVLVFSLILICFQKSGLF